MKRDDVLALVVKKVKETVPELRAAEIDPGKSYKDLGIKSLDLVDIATATMREVKVKIPPAQLSKVNNINGMVDLLLKAAGN